jgi:hypothetical protein
MSLRTAVTTFLQRRRGAKAEAAAARHDASRAVRREAAPTTRAVAVGGQTGSTV